MKNKILSIVLLGLIIIAIVGVNIYEVFAAAMKAETLAIAARNNYKSFWDVKVGEPINESGIEDNKNTQNWICFSHKDTTGLGTTQKIQAIIDINTNGVGTYKINGKNTTYTNDSNMKKLAYLCYAATVDSSSGLVGNSGATASKRA